MAGHRRRCELHHRRITSGDITCPKTLKSIWSAAPPVNPRPITSSWSPWKRPPCKTNKSWFEHAFLSLDPYMRGRMNDTKSYTVPQPLNSVMIGGTVGEVVESRHPKFAAGDKVVGMGGWQTYSVVDADTPGMLRKVDTTHVPISHLPGRGRHARRHRMARFGAHHRGQSRSNTHRQCGQWCCGQCLWCFGQSARLPCGRHCWGTKTNATMW